MVSAKAESSACNGSLAQAPSRQRNATDENRITDYQGTLFTLESWCPVIWLPTTIRASVALKWSLGRCVGVRPGVRAPSPCSVEVKVLHITVHGVIPLSYSVRKVCCRVLDLQSSESIQLMISMNELFNSWHTNCKLINLN